MSEYSKGVRKLKTITNSKIYNMYGPTETTVWSTYAKVTDTENIHIGKPISNTQIYILDKNTEPTPIKAIIINSNKIKIVFKINFNVCNSAIYNQRFF